MAYHFCTCDRNFDSDKGRHRAKNGLTPYREVEVDANGMCMDCGHATASTRIWLSPDNGELRTYLMPTVVKNTENRLERRRITYKERKEK